MANSIFLYLFFSFAVLMLMACDPPLVADPVSYVVPEGFIGRVVVVYDTTKHYGRNTNVGKRNYRIPNSGLLYTSDPPNPGASFNGHYKFLRMDSVGRLNELPYLNGLQISRSSYPPGVTQNTVCAMYGGYLSSMTHKDSLGNSHVFKNGFMLYSIDTLKNIGKYTSLPDFDYFQ